MLCAHKTDPSTIVELQTASCPTYGHELTAGETPFTGDRQRASRFIPDSSHTIPEHVWGDEGPTTV
jgi:hypothetical protein